MQQIVERGRFDPNPMDLLPELEVERVMLALALSMLDQDDAEYSPTIKAVTGITILAREIVNTVSKINQVRSKTSLTKGEVSWLMITLKRGIKQFVPEENREAFFQWLKAQNLDQTGEADS